MTKTEICEKYQQLMRERPDAEDMYLELAEIIDDANNTCEGCIFKPKNRGNYQSECGECSRWYADGYRSQNKHETGV